MHHIRYFLAVSETLNLTRAAERCNVAQPALTRAIKSLENELGGELLRRERALSHLTDLGQRMLPMLRQCYEAALAAKMVAASIKKGDAVPLSVAISNTVALKPFTAILQKLSHSFPGLELKVSRGSGSEVAEHLKLGAAELVIAGPIREAWSRLDVHPLFEEPFGLLVSPTHRLAGNDKVEFKDLASETFIINGQGEMVGEVRACLQANGLAKVATHEVEAQEDLLSLLKADMGVAIIPVGVTETDGLCQIPLKQLSLVRSVSVYTVAGRHHGIAYGTLFNMLRAADWSAGQRTRQRKRAGQ